MLFPIIKRYIVVLVFVLIPLLLSAQTQSDSIKAEGKPTEKSKMAKPIKYPHFEWGFSVGYNMQEIASDNEAVALTNAAFPSGGVFFELRINKWLGIETGCNYLMYSGEAKLSVNEYSTTQNGLIDVDGDTYNATYSALGVKESWDASYIEIPFAVKLQLMAGNWTFYLKPGIAYNVLASSSYTQSGNYARSGYYPNYNISFIDLPSHGFYKMTKGGGNGSPAFINYISPFIGAGIVFPAKRGNLFMEARYYPAMATIVEPDDGTLFEGPSDLGKLSTDYQFESITEESRNVTMSGFIFNLGFRF